ncbi:hypothetical protein SteCoe_22422 [Stentor coeruleus]|uniref:Uncharacterized protein n=1 Tax=Stentor coeruleus TaxID=5963 RepID=A0A1R2BMF2_9CILI|nr:hypothetical protein SteCoe_22422 [Stentor coeruleus]
MQESDCVTYKIIIIGDGTVGKTSLVKRIVDNQFSYSTPLTIGVDNYSKILAINSTTKINLSIWDTAGQERFSMIAPSYFRGSHAAIIVFDITNEKSFRRVEYWTKQIKEYAASNIKVMLIGNKIDMEDKRKVIRKVSVDFARTNNMMFFETSCFNATNVERAFLELGRKLHEDEFRPNYSENGAERMEDEGKKISLVIPAPPVKPKKKKKFC